MGESLEMRRSRLKSDFQGSSRAQSKHVGRMVVSRLVF